MSDSTSSGQGGGGFNFPAADKAGGQSGSGGSYHNGVWMSKCEGARNQMYHRWTEEKNKSKEKQLTKQEHSSMVRLHGQSLDVRKELRGLQRQRKPHSTTTATTHGPQHATPYYSTSLNPGMDSHHAYPTTSSVSSSSSTGSLKGLRKTPSSGSLTSAASSGYSSHSSPSLGRRTSGGVGELMEGEGGARATAAGRGGGKGFSAGLRASLNLEASTKKFNNLHSSRTLSKLNNDMDISQ